MSSITITIDTSNAAFEENEDELSDILDDLADSVEEHAWKYMNTMPIKDSNGNTVGRLTVSE